MPLNLSENQSDIHERLSAEPDRTSSIFERLRSAVAASSLVLVTQALSAIGCTKGSDQPFPDAKQIPQTASSGTAFVDDNKTAHTTACPPDKQHQLVQEFQGLATTVAQCTPCHRPGGVGWQPQNQHGWEWDASPDAANLQTSFNGFYRVSSILDANGQPYIVTHPQEKDGTKHGGGKQSLDQAQVTQLTQFSADIRKYVESLGGIKDGKLPEPPQISTDCEDPILDNKDFFADLELANSSAVYLKFLRNVTGADIPDNEPKIQTKDQLRQMLLVATNSPGFYDWLKTNLNDITLTRGLANDKKNDKKNKVSELIADTYGIDWSQFDTGDIVDSPQNLFAWMVKNDRSIKELGTAQYIVTPGIKPAQGQPDNWLARLQAQVVTEIPVSGLPTDIMWLGRHPSTKTNVHRNDSLLLLRQFYDLDVLSLGSRKLPPPPAGSLYPTLTYPPCLTCHAGSPLDLVARSMAKFDYITGKFMPKALEPPPISLINLGVYGKTIPHNDYSALRKLMGLLTWDPELSSSDPGFDANNKYRFAKAMSKMAFKFLMQHDPSIAPKDGEANYAEKNRRFKVEDKFLNEM
ncbi:hypothetical protein HZA40_03710, partial [Candidatus Peregrinibacteria bacterium]|nr:hypothetical protein [Candidatus Peregrinibacteria bacterium]